MNKANLYRGLKYGLAAGLVSTILMDLISLILFSFMGESLPDCFALFGRSFLTLIGVETEYPLWQGLVLHYSIGIFTGLALGALTQTIRVLRFDTYKKGILIGVIVTEIEGAALFFFMSLILNITASDMVRVYELGAILHLVWGTFIGTIIAFGQKRTGQIPEYSGIPVKN
jgi:hypothetical protein